MGSRRRGTALELYWVACQRCGALGVAARECEQWYREVSVRGAWVQAQMTRTGSRRRGTASELNWIIEHSNDAWV